MRARTANARGEHRALRSRVAEGDADRDTMLHLAESLEQQGRWTRAAQIYETLAARDRADELVASRLAIALARAGRRHLANAAIAAYGLADARSPAAAVACATVAEAFDLADEAVALRRDLAGRAPDEPEAIAALAVSLARAQRHAEAASTLADARARFADDIAVRRAAVLVALEAPGHIDLGAWRALVDRGAVEEGLVGEALEACVRRGATKIALRILADAAPSKLEEPIPRALVALLSQQDDPERVLRQVVRALEGAHGARWIRLFRPLVKAGRYRLARLLVDAIAIRDRGAAIDDLRAIARTLPDDAELPADAARALASDRSLVVLPAADPVATVLVFTGNVGASQLLHAQLMRRNVNAVYLRHSKPRLYFLDGIPGQAEGYDDALELLGDVVAFLQRPVYVIGQSMPGFAAIRYAIDLEADGVLALNTPTDLRPAFMERDGRSPRTYARIRDELPEMAVALAPILAAAPRRPKVSLYYNGNAVLDERQASRLASAPSVSLHPVGSGDQHNVLFPMLRLGLVDEALDELLEAAAG